MSKKEFNKPLKYSLIVGGIVSAFSFFYGGIYTEMIQEGIGFSLENILLALVGAIIAGLPFFIITLIITNVIKSVKENDKKFPITGWKWVFYILGWLFGFLNLLFWLIMYALHMANNYGDPFFNKDFHRRVYIWGIVITILIISALVMVFFLE
jgi:hypothetical protein